MQELLKEVCDKCRPIVEILIKRMEELERRLLAYENAHTPPSRGDLEDIIENHNTILKTFVVFYNR